MHRPPRFFLLRQEQVDLHSYTPAYSNLHPLTRCGVVISTGCVVVVGMNQKSLGRASSAEAQEMDDILETSGFTRARADSPPPVGLSAEEAALKLKRLSTRVAADLSPVLREEKVNSVREERNDELQLVNARYKHVLI
jgi:hypothetical protein